HSLAVSVFGAVPSPPRTCSDSFPSRGGERWGEGRRLRFARILLIREPVELDVVESPAGLLDLAYVHRLHDVARFRIDRDRTARTDELHALHRGDELVPIGRAAGLLQRLVDQRHAVVAPRGHEVRTQLVAVDLGV